MTNVKNFALLLYILFVILQPSYAYKVYISTGHKCNKELLDKSTFPFTAENVDGLWCMPWNWRNNENTIEEFKLLVSNFTSKKMVVEIEMGHFKLDNGEPIQLNLAKKAGANIHTLMLYNEQNRNGSSLTLAEIENMRKKYGNTYKLITNIRNWSPETQKPLFDVLDGVSFEFNAGASDMNNTNTPRWPDVAKAVNWCIENNKIIYLLTPPGHKPGMTGNQIRERFAIGYRELLAYLEKEIGKEKLANADNVIFVPSNYDFSKRPVHLSPESDPQTVSAVCKFLIENKK
jgi:hypothetical protein